MKSGIRIVMVATSHPGNIGAAARAMKNMCLSELVLVQPKDFPSDAAFARASGADDLLRAAVVTGSLAEAVADCRTVIGASARLRSVRWPQLAPREAAALAVAESRSAPVALVFGRESAGLSNQELDLCTHLVQIPTNPAYSSLNVAMAVQVISYEVMLASQAAERRPDEAAGEVASIAEMEGLFAHLEQALADIGFIDERRSEKLLRRLRRLFHRAAPESDEVNILRGILSAAQGRKSMRRGAGG
ncbi:MAG: RNA methyltransferase [Chromatiaceae bacterium]|nr:RNA methyltransferase [Gammaproteobacteria bacterium]MCP5304665.1 RNA methyltransferase [Chromatiaceae bacterium]MCP5314392.1 RNA methyltransferase [Chromatiaceae bacterium]